MLIPLGGSWSMILGASSGMGRAAALALSRAGSNIIGVHFDHGPAADSVAALVKEIEGYGVQARFWNMNAASVRTRAEVVPMVAELTDGAGPRVVMHSLAFGSLVPYLPRTGHGSTLAQRQLEMTVDVMAHSLVYWVQDLVAAGLLRRGAKIFAMTSAGVVQALPSYGAVSAAKAALESHVRQLACELAPRGVAVNALRAGVTVTPSLRRIPEHAEFVARAGRGNPHGRLTEPEDVAETVVLLSGTDSSWLTGNTIGVDGGELLAAGDAWELGDDTAANGATSVTAVAVDR
ncbi:SDR family oxidoreductase [Micromonospora sp. WMMA1947]|uniref:SDR family oxidoreductase n=1 Tax=Micromonospora sp. WMMA1947 TaxID=3015163 RepID=UPI00248D3009|nr:SDR family oxidoreductase [Micromonospora sp. WMMA1947]WBC07493.1 SDR family oxidoreductase [Micromonospora sp. WMMA1947]